MQNIYNETFRWQECIYMITREKVKIGHIYFPGMPSMHYLAIPRYYLGTYYLGKGRYPKRVLRCPKRTQIRDCALPMVQKPRTKTKYLTNLDSWDPK